MRGKVRKLQDNLNLIPYMDLFSTLIMFLLVTAVFDQVSVVPTNLGALDKGSALVQAKQVKKITSDLKIVVSKDNIKMIENGKVQNLPMPENPEGFIQVGAFLDGVRTRNPEKKDVVLEATDDSVYENLIHVMDRCLERDFTELVLAGGE